MPIPKRDVVQMLERCRNLILRRAALDLPPKPTSIPGFNVEDVYEAHYKTAERARMADMLIDAGLADQVARAKEGARVNLKTNRPGFRFNSALPYDFLPISGYEPARRYDTRLYMSVQTSGAAWNGTLTLQTDRLPRPLLFTLAGDVIENSSASYLIAGLVNYNPTSQEAQHFIQQYYSRQYLWLHSMRYYMEQLAVLLSEAASWKAVYREVPMLEHIWSATSGKYLSGARRKGKPNPLYEDLSEMLAGALLVPDDDKWREHCVI